LRNPGGVEKVPELLHVEPLTNVIKLFGPYFTLYDNKLALDCLHWRHLLAKLSVKATYDYTCLGHLGLYNGQDGQHDIAAVIVSDITIDI
jgi:hypothetical protein